ncbi:MAG: metallophosphoesterase, partial [Bacteroidota bacterium]
MPWFVVYGLIILAPLVGIYYYNIKHLLNAFESLWNWNRRKARRWVLTVVTLANLLPLAALVTFWIGGRQATQAFAGENRIVDYLLVYPFWFALVIAVQFFLLLAIWELLKLVLFPVYRKRKDSWRTFEQKATVVFFLFAFTYSCFTIYTNTWTIRVNEREVKLPRQFSALDGLRIVQISDVQGDGRTTPDYIGRLVEQANSFEPDLILYGGDVVTSGPKYVESTVAVLSGLKARYAKIAAVGDHDMFSGKKPIIEGMTRAGFIVLEDSTITLTINKTKVVVTGLIYT